MRTFFHLQKSDTVYQAKFCRFGNIFMRCVVNMNIARIVKLCLENIGCQGVKLLLLKDCLKLSEIGCSEFEFWVFSQLEFRFGCYLSFWVLLVFEFCWYVSFVTIWVLSEYFFCVLSLFEVIEFCCYSSSGILSKFKFLSFAQFEFLSCQKLGFWVVSHFGLVTIWVFILSHF